MTSTAQLVGIDQTWRRKADRMEATIRQVWRRDRLVQVRRADGGLEYVRFTDLRRKWEQIG